MSCQPPPTLCLVAGQNCALPFTFTAEGGGALNLTGSTVHFVAKESYLDADADAVIAISQASHTDAANGATSLVFDLSGLDEVYWDRDRELVADIWVVDSSANRIPYGAVVARVQPSAKYRPTS